VSHPETNPSQTVDQITDQPANQRILAVDDDPIMREMMMARLGDNINVSVAENGQVAWEKLLKEDFDLAIIDLGMPQLDGFGLIQYLRQTPKTVDLPIIVATSRSDQEAIEKAFASGASSFVTKPINWSLFQYQLQFVLKQGAVEKQLRASNSAVELTIRAKDQLLKIMSHALENQHSTNSHDTSKPNLSDILLLARMLSNDLKPDFSKNDVNTIIGQSIAACQNFAIEKSVKVIGRKSLANTAINVDPKIWLETLKRLVCQSIKSAPAGGTVEILPGSQGNGSLVISVRDNGPIKLQSEIDQQVNILLNNGFEDLDKFSIPDLNMPIVNRGVEIHNGRVIFQNKTGEGNISALWLPASRVHIEQLERSA